MRPRRLSFYRRLSAAAKREYDRSDAQKVVPLVPDPALGLLANRFVGAVEEGSRARAARAGQDLLDRICAALAPTLRVRLPAPKLRVLRVRPHGTAGELHGLYTAFEDGRSEIRLWFHTAAERRVVKPRTFLRTLLHELCHHLDMCWLDLPRSLHTMGFHARESSLFGVLERSGAVVPGARPKAAATATPPPRAEAAAIRTRPPQQLELFQTA